MKNTDMDDNRRDFYYMLKMSQQQVKNKNLKYLKLVLTNLLDYIQNSIKQDPESEIEEILNGVRDYTLEYLKKISHTAIRPRTVEYCLSKKLFGQEYSVGSIYKELLSKERSKQIDILNMDLSNEEYSYNVRECLEKVILIIMQDIRYGYKILEEEMEKDESVRAALTILAIQPTKKDRNRIIQKACSSKPETQQYMEQMLELFLLKNGLKSEKEEIEKRVRENTENARVELKKDCIVSIVESVKFLDKFGFLEQYVNLSNKEYKNIYMHNMDYDYEEVKQLLSEEYLETLNIDQLILLSAFWINRVNKIVKEINTALYILSCGELMSSETDETKIVIEDETIEKVALKMQLIHRIYSNVFFELERQRAAEGKEVLDINEEITQICKRNGKKYKEYFDSILPDSENDIRQDILFSNIYENAVFNSYKIKNGNIQALLISLLNSNSSMVQNYGYMEEDSREDIKSKKVVLVGVDLKGFNMPLRLHIKKDVLIDLLKSIQNGSTRFPKYVGEKDFTMSCGKILTTHIYVPLTKEKEQALEANVSQMTSKGKYANTARHLYYLTSKGKMPEHMKRGKKKFRLEYIDLDPDDNDREIDE